MREGSDCPGWSLNPGGTCPGEAHARGALVQRERVSNFLVKPTCVPKTYNTPELRLSVSNQDCSNPYFAVLTCIQLFTHVMCSVSLGIATRRLSVPETGTQILFLAFCLLRV